MLSSNKHSFFFAIILISLLTQITAAQQGASPQWPASPNPVADIVIVGIDAQTLDNIGYSNGADGLTYRGSFPLDRSWYAKLTTELVKAEARIIAFDMQFGPEADPQSGKLFALAVKKSPVPVIIGFEEIPRPLPYVSKVDLRRYATRIQPANSNAPQADFLALPFQEILSAGALLGSTATHDDPDNVLRNMPLFVKNSGYVLPAITLQIFLQSIGASVADIQLSASASGRFLSVHGKQFPLSADDGFRVAFPPHKSAFVFRSFYDVVTVKDAYKKGAAAAHDRRMKSWFRDKIVIVGFQDASLKDLKRTPAGGSYPGVEALAAAVNHLLNVYAGPGAVRTAKGKPKRSLNEKPSKPPRNTNIDIAVEQLKKIE
ncbi:MAG: CHASE2 domain-containing protein [bacterium]